MITTALFLSLGSCFQLNSTGKRIPGLTHRAVRAPARIETKGTPSFWTVERLKHLSPFAENTKSLPPADMKLSRCMGDISHHELGH